MGSVSHSLALFGRCLKFSGSCTYLPEVVVSSADSDCAPGECCDSDNKCTTTCVGKSCTYNGDCATGEYCCDYNERCETSCTIKSCTYDGDCASGECCDSDNKCTTGDCYVLKGLANWIVAVIVIGVVVVIVYLSPGADPGFFIR